MALGEIRFGKEIPIESGPHAGKTLIRTNYRAWSLLLTPDKNSNTRRFFSQIVTTDTDEAFGHNDQQNPVMRFLMMDIGKLFLNLGRMDAAVILHPVKAASYLAAKVGMNAVTYGTLAESSQTIEEAKVHLLALAKQNDADLYPTEADAKRARMRMVDNDLDHRRRIDAIQFAQPMHGTYVAFPNGFVPRSQITLQLDRDRIRVPLYGLPTSIILEGFVQFGDEGLAKIFYDTQLQTFKLDIFTRQDNIVTQNRTPANTKPGLPILGAIYKQFELDAKPYQNNGNGQEFYSPPNGSFWALFNQGLSSRYSAGESAEPDWLVFEKGVNQKQLEVALYAFRISLVNYSKADAYIREHYNIMVPKEMTARRANNMGQHSVYSRIVAGGGKLPPGVHSGDIPQAGGMHPAIKIDDAQYGP